MSAFGLVEQVAEWLRLRRQGVVSQGAKPPSASRTPKPHRTASDHPVPSPPPAKPPAPGCHRSRRSPAAGCPSGQRFVANRFGEQPFDVGVAAGRFVMEQHQLLRARAVADLVLAVAAARRRSRAAAAKMVAGPAYDDTPGALIAAGRSKCVKSLVILC